MDERHLPPPAGRETEAGEGAVSRVAFADAARVWLRIGLIGFGGPAGQIALMHRVLVEDRKWIGESRFVHALNYCMLLPGPEAQQLATYVGWLLHGTRGGLVAGTLFVLPGALVILALSVLYAGFHDLTLVQALFYGIKAAVLAVVVEAVIRIGRRALRTRAMVAVAAAAFVAIFVFDVPFPLIIAAAGLLGLCLASLGIAGLGRRGRAASPPAGARDHGPAGPRPSPARTLRVAALWFALWLGPVAVLFALLGRGHVFVEEALFFSKMAVVTFGGAYAVLAYVAQQAVATYGWLAPGEMLDGLGLAETTPGPLILVLQFVGFLAAFRNAGGLDPMLAGCLGALLTTWVTFVPSFLWIFLGAPYMEALRGRPALDGALTAITAAVVGVVLNLALWFAAHVLFAEIDEIAVFPLRLVVPVWQTVDPGALALAVAALIALVRFRAGMIPTLAASAALGAAWFFLGL